MGYEVGEVIIGKNIETGSINFIGIVYRSSHACLLTYKPYDVGFHHNERWCIKPESNLELLRMDRDERLELVLDYFDKYKLEKFESFLLYHSSKDFILDKIKQFKLMKYKNDWGQ